MKIIAVVSLLLLLNVNVLKAYAGDNPVADPAAVVVQGNARFTVLGPRLIRMEWASDGKFEDRPTLGVVNRLMPVPEYSVRQRSGSIVIRTEALTLTYTGRERFDSTNLSVMFGMPDLQTRKGVRTVVWRLGADDSGNLLGTVRTLDSCDGVRTADPFDKGVVSRDGWAVIDESDRQVLAPEDTDWEHWVENRPAGDRQDLYIFAYGHDYKAAVSDFIKIGGKIPLPPKYAFGYWWSRYWQYSDYEIVDLCRQIRRYDIPIDVMIIDMDWHNTWTLSLGHSQKDEFGQSIGWTGYTWQKYLFPAPENCLHRLHGLGVKTALNLHPASGIQPYEEPYGRFVKDYLSRASDYDGPRGYVKDDGEPAPVPFRIDDEAWADAYFNSVIHPLERQGVDFWWLDWQQWRTSRYVPGLSNTFWLNYTFFNDRVRQSAVDGIYAARPMIYHRWGGIGNHRYPVAFSGDTYATWKVLSYLPWFTSTASNVGFGYWGHDAGGFKKFKGMTATDPELYTRWLQSAVFMPVFKTHSSKDPVIEKRFWMFPEHFPVMRDAIRLRYSLSPYIYGAAREAYDTGISICRPMYYDWPESDEAYSFTEEYMFGDDILATALCQPADSVTGLTERVMWFPEGSDWYDVASGRLIPGGSIDTLHYAINENPYYVKAGAIIPMASEKISSLQEKSDVLRLYVAPGDGRSSVSVYEDDGETQAYMAEYATTVVTKDSDASSLRLYVAPRKGTYRGIDPGRRIQAELACVFAPSSVRIDGVEIPYSRFADDEWESLSSPVWTYSGADLSVRIYLPASSASEAVTIECAWPEDLAPLRGLLYGKKGLLHRMMAISEETKLMFGRYVNRVQMMPSEFLSLLQCGSFITEHPSDAPRYLLELDVASAIASMESFGKLPPQFLSKLHAYVEE